MKKVMFYCHVFYPQSSGYSNAFQNLINAILNTNENLEITVITPFLLDENTSELKRDRLTVVRLQPTIKMRKIRYFLNEYFYAKKVSKKFIDEKYDFLLIETFDQSLFINFLDAKVLEKTAIRVHSTNETEYTFFDKGLAFQLRKFLIKCFLIKKIKWILSTNSYHINFVKKYFYDGNQLNIAETNFFVLPNVVNSLEPKSYHVGEKIKILTLGRMDYLGNNQKGFTDFIYALKLLPQSVIKQFDIKIVGQGDMRNDLIKLCQKETNIDFIESLTHSEVLAELQNSDVVLLPSRYEGLSMFALEGIATGNACLFSNTGGLIDMLESNGIFFEAQNIESLAEALVKLSNLEVKELERMKKESVELCKRKFSSEVVSKKFNTILNLITKV